MAADPRDLATVAEYKARFELEDTESDAVIQEAITYASVTLMREYGWRWAPAASAKTRDFPLLGGVLIDLHPHVLRAATTVTLKPDGSATVLDSDDFKLLPIGGVELDDDDAEKVYTEMLLSGQLFTGYSSELAKFGTYTVRILGNWGFSEVPESVKNACLTCAREWLRSGAPADGTYWQEAHEGQPLSSGSWGIPVSARRLLNVWRRNAGAL